MNSSICGVDCTKCELKNTCQGCVKTKGHPFGGSCIIASCCEDKKYDNCNKCSDKFCQTKKQLIAEFNELAIKDMEEVTDLNALKGSFVNLEYNLANGQTIKLLDDEKIYFGNQICKPDGSRCYGLAADENYLLVCEYGIDGSNPEIIIYKKR